MPLGQLERLLNPLVFDKIKEQLKDISNINYIELQARIGVLSEILELQTFGIGEDFIKFLGNQITYKWLKEILSEKIEKSDPKAVCDKTKKEIREILKNDGLTSFLIILEEYGFIELSNNLKNTFDKEIEVKILDINKKELVGKLEDLHCEKVFSGKVKDTYYDFEDGSLENNKISFRIREKIDEEGKSHYYYTIKSKRKYESLKTGMRICDERELKIHNLEIFNEILEKRFGLRKVKEKVKKRTSYDLRREITEGEAEFARFDIDTIISFGWLNEKGIWEVSDLEIPDLLEIELENPEFLEALIKELCLQDNKRLNTGSSGLIQHYRKKREKAKKLESNQEPDTDPKLEKKKKKEKSKS